MYPDVLLHINGKWTPSESGRTLEVLNPATGDVNGNLAHAGIPDLDRALAAAETGFALWRKVSAFERSKLLRRAADLLRSRADDIARLMVLEQGKPLPEAKLEAVAGADIIDWFAEEARRIYGRLIPARVEGVYQMSLREPVGPVAAFTPWNFPINQANRKIAIALAAGCSIIVKGPEETPASCAELVRCYIDAGLPPGVVQLVFGTPSEISEYLIPHPIIRKISFTGSTPVGKQLRRPRRPTHEARHHGARRPRPRHRVRRRRHRRRHQAARRRQVPQRRPGLRQPHPASSSRRRSYDEFVEGMTTYARALKVGDGLEPGTQMGPLANPRRITANGIPHRRRRRQRRRSAHRRQAHRQQGQLLRTHRHDRRQQGDARHERGALRPPRPSSPPSAASRTSSPKPTASPTALPATPSPAPPKAPPPSPPASKPA